MNKLKCIILGHKNTSVECPFTKVSYKVCSRCSTQKDTAHRFQ